MKLSNLIVLSLLVVVAAPWIVPASAKDDVGSVIALRGHAIINRENKDSEAKVKDGILLTDRVSTLEASRAKMLFRDDSVLTLGEKSKVVIKEFLYGKDRTGKTIINLVDGKMKSVVGKAQFEVHTPTSVAAARGTVIYFDEHILKGKQCTTIYTAEGTVIARSSSEKIKGSITLTKDLMATICMGEPLPKPSKISSQDREMFLNDTDVAGSEISLSVPGGGAVGATGADVGAPPFDQQPVTTGTTIVPPPTPQPPGPPSPPPPGPPPPGIFMPRPTPPPKYSPGG